VESDDDMALSMLKEQLTHFKTKKINEKECKDPLTWWKTHPWCIFPMLGL
jgi:hypothetical protein